MELILESVKRWYSDYKNTQHINSLSHFINNLKRNDNTSLIEAINTGLDAITTNHAHDIKSLMSRANVLCEQVSNALDVSTASDISKKQLSPKLQNKFISLLEPIVLKIADYYEEPEIKEEVTPMLLMWILEESKKFKGNLLNDDMTAISDEFMQYLHKGVNISGKTIPLIYLTATKIADRTRGKSNTFAGNIDTQKEIGVDTSRLVSSLMDELDSIIDWSNKNPAFKSTERLDKKWADYFKLLWKNPDISGTEVIKQIPDLPYNIKSKGKAPTVHGEGVKRAGQKLINILSKHPTWKNKVGSLRGAIAELSQV